MNSITGIDHVQIAAPPGCENDARHFFADLLGLPELEKPPALAVRGGCWFRAGTHELHVGVADPFVPASKAHPALRLDTEENLRALAARLRAAGVPVTWADPAEISGVERFHAPDPWGNRLEFVAPAG
jgi:catechol 2,3-dioxygenase-like lactoylglutathione lyase family enzyme